jgi:hypothetical protein
MDQCLLRAESIPGPPVPFGSCSAVRPGHYLVPIAASSLASLCVRCGLPRTASARWLLGPAKSPYLDPISFSLISSLTQPYLLQIHYLYSTFEILFLFLLARKEYIPLVALLLEFAISQCCGYYGRGLCSRNEKPEARQREEHPSQFPLPEPISLLAFMPHSCFPPNGARRTP